jgi:hypothetical protein
MRLFHQLKNDKAVLFRIEKWFWTSGRKRSNII